MNAGYKKPAGKAQLQIANLLHLLSLSNVKAYEALHLVKTRQARSEKPHRVSTCTQRARIRLVQKMGPSCLPHSERECNPHDPRPRFDIPEWEARHHTTPTRYPYGSFRPSPLREVRRHNAQGFGEREISQMAYRSKASQERHDVAKAYEEVRVGGPRHVRSLLSLRRPCGQK